MADFEDVMAQRPQVIVCNVEFLSSKKVAKGFIVTLKLLGLLFQVRDVILDLLLSPSGQPPIVCIDESQVTFWQQIHIPPSCEIFFCPPPAKFGQKVPLESRSSWVCCDGAPSHSATSLHDWFAGFGQ